MRFARGVDRQSMEKPSFYWRNARKRSPFKRVAKLMIAARRLRSGDRADPLPLSINSNFRAKTISRY